MDQLVYTSRWRKHVSRTIGELKHDISSVGEIDIVVVSFLTVSSQDPGVSFVRIPPMIKPQLKSGDLQCEYFYYANSPLPHPGHSFIDTLHPRPGRNVYALA